MKPLIRWALFLAVPLLLLGVSASAATAPAAKAKPITPHTLVTTKGLMHGFAQEGNEIAWISGQVGKKWTGYVRGVNGRTVTPVGKADMVDYDQPGHVITLPLALAGKRVLWTTFSGGASWTYTGVATSAPGKHPVSVALYSHWEQGRYEGSPVRAVLGDGATLAYGVVSEDCPTIENIPRECPTLYAWPGGGVFVVTDRSHPPPIAGIAQPAGLALSQGRVAVVPAALPRPNDGYGARPVVNGPINVYDLAGTLVSAVRPVGTVRQITLAWPLLYVIVERPNGIRELERYNTATGKRLLGVTPREIPQAATCLAASDAGAVYRIGKTIFFLGTHERTIHSVWKTKAAPIGLSIEGKRIAWAENVRGHGRIVALTLR